MLFNECDKVVLQKGNVSDAYIFSGESAMLLSVCRDIHAYDKFRSFGFHNGIEQINASEWLLHWL